MQPNLRPLSDQAVDRQWCRTADHQRRKTYEVREVRLIAGQAGASVSLGALSGRRGKRLGQCVGEFLTLPGQIDHLVIERADPH